MINKSNGQQHGHNYRCNHSHTESHHAFRAAVCFRQRISYMAILFVISPPLFVIIGVPAQPLNPKPSEH